MAASDEWPELSYAAWKDTYATLHLWTQIVGKTCVALVPWLNHSWHIALRVTARGLATPLMHTGGRDLQMELDFVDHVLWLRRSSGESRSIELKPMPVADFHIAFMKALAELRIDVRVHGVPNEMPDTIPFAEDRTHKSYDREFANRFWRILLRTDEVFSYFRTSFIGKTSPVHFFSGGIPNLPDTITREAYSHEVSSAGFWPGGSPIDYAAFYSYAYPAADGYASSPVRPAQAFFHKELGEFILPYEAVRTASDPKATLLAFLHSTYVAAAETGKWNRADLECELGEPGKPRSV
jgi:Family of unknown function (DUF5996)